MLRRPSSSSSRSMVPCSTAVGRGGSISTGLSRCSARRRARRPLAGQWSRPAFFSAQCRVPASPRPSPWPRSPGRCSNARAMIRRQPAGLPRLPGIGATLSPPTLGDAAFIIAEYLEISYLDVLVMATIPTVLYYLCCWLMVEADARRLHVKPVKTSDQSLWRLTLGQGYHFLSLAAIAVLLIYGMSAFLAVFWSIVIAVILSMIRPEQRLVTLPGAQAGLAV